ncbi:hypothetical protein [Spirillospora albida]|uniref:hypothetical protein n=1 Tax=Spirillospora albida TaxID=58123 RepID=UPI0012F8BBBB|nr:hypothetical protein [Spirillospora albida]
MQLPRVVIAAVFFVIGALIAVPALVNWASDSNAEEPQAARTTTSASPSPTGSSPSPTATRTSPSPARTSPTPSRTTAAPAQPVTATIGKPICPGRTVNVVIRNTGAQEEDFGIEKNDGTAAVPGTIGAGRERTIAVKLREDRRTRIEVNWANKLIKSATVRANCTRAEPDPGPSETPGDLPHTGPDGSVMWARAATGAAAMVTGVIIFWYGGIWPRRREKIFPKD